ncbi:MAG: PilZ domain-containing protein, partial [Candidatus Omnitrophica bacterium]|nr:PilZ domain-containing protein [Candidatus Omnitrophota bacterium]
MKKEEYKNNCIIERRRFIRHPISLPLKYKVIKQGASAGSVNLEAETKNISIGGLSFPAKRPVKADSMIAISMPFEDKVFNIKAKVVRCENNPETKLYDIAVNFFRLHEAFKVKMIEQIYLIAEYRDLLTLETGKEVS